MPGTQVEEIIALTVVFVVHLVGGGLLVWALLDGEQRNGWRRRWGRGGEPDPPPAPEPPPRGSSLERPPLPLTDSGPGRVRLREPLRAADRYRRPARRPEHEPQPQRAPARQRQRAG